MDEHRKVKFGGGLPIPFILPTARSHAHNISITHAHTVCLSPTNQTNLPQHTQVGTYVDKKCPFTGNVAIRGRILKGIVVSTKMTRTLIIRRDYLHWISKYKR